MNFMAAWEGQLPAAFFEFDRKTVDFAAVFHAAAPLLNRTHDVRLLALLAKFAILNRDLGGFANQLASIAWLLAHHWDEVHPRAEDGDFFSRLAQLGTLDDGPVVVLPLQYAPLLETQRDGVLVYRAWMVARGDAKARDGETLVSSAAIDRIAANVPMEALAEAVATIDRIRVALATIETVSRERVGSEYGIEFKALAPLVARIADFLREISIKRDPSLAPSLPALSEAGDARGERAESTTSAPPPAFATLADVDAALSAALGYFAQSEPSSPARLLVAQARETLGKNLYDVMRLLAPTHADAARVFVGPDGAFTVLVSALTNSPSAEIERVEAPPAPSRAEALAILEAVATHLRRVEPSSPAPFLLDRARTLAARDFVSLLQDLLPADDLSSMKQGQ